MESGRRVRGDKRALEDRRRALLPKESPRALARLASELEAENTELRREATEDPLTGILNRRGFNDGFKENVRLLEHSFGYDRVAFFLVDVDNFKEFNTRFGAPGGDAVLKSIAKILKNEFGRGIGNDILRRGIDIVGRWGGDEFVISCLIQGDQEADAVAEKIKKAVAEKALAFAKLPTETLSGDTSQPEITVSIGIVEVEEEIDPELLHREVSRALLKAKKNGKNGYVNLGKLRKSERVA